MPNFSTSWADTTKTATMYSDLISLLSTSSIFANRPSKYLPEALLARRSFMVSRHSCMPSETPSILLFLTSAYFL